MSEEEEKITLKRNEGRKIRSRRSATCAGANGVTGAVEEEGGKEGKKKVVGWSTERMEDKTSKREFKDTEERVQWRSINQGGFDNLWKETMEEEVLEKYKVEENENGAYEGRGEPLEWRIVQRLRKWCEDQRIQPARKQTTCKQVKQKRRR